MIEALNNHWIAFAILAAIFWMTIMISKWAKNDTQRFIIGLIAVIATGLFFVVLT